MTLTERSTRDEWNTDDDTEAKLGLYEEIGEALKSAARRGFRRRQRVDPPEHDVEDVVVRAFNELWAMDLSTLDSPLRMGCKIAYRRGFDRADQIARERKTATQAVRDRAFVGAEDPPDLDEDDFAAKMAIVRRCQDELTPDQRAVIDATVEGTRDGTVSLKDFAELRGTTYEACRRMCQRGLAALARCVAAAGLTAVG